MLWFPENRSALGGWEYRRTKSSAQSSATGPRLKSFSPSPDERQHCDIICRCGKFNWISHFSSSCGLGPRRGLSSIFFPSTHKAQPTANNAQNGYCFPLFREGTGSIGNEKKKKNSSGFSASRLRLAGGSGMKVRNVSGLPGSAKHDKWFKTGSNSIRVCGDF